MQKQEVSAEDKAISQYTAIGGMALLAGGAIVGIQILERFNIKLVPNAPSPGLGIALFVGGFLACAVIPPLHRRIQALEERVRALEGTPSSTLTE